MNFFFKVLDLYIYILLKKISFVPISQLFSFARSNSSKWYQRNWVLPQTQILFSLYLCNLTVYIYNPLSQILNVNSVNLLLTIFFYKVSLQTALLYNNFFRLALEKFGLNLTNEDNELNKYSGYVYDAVWLYAIALDNLIK